jgi:hypothetical protein
MFAVLNSSELSQSVAERFWTTSGYTLIDALSEREPNDVSLSRGLDQEYPLVNNFYEIYTKSCNPEEFYNDVVMFSLEENLNSKDIQYLKSVSKEDILNFEMQNSLGNLRNVCLSMLSKGVLDKEMTDLIMTKYPNFDACKIADVVWLRTYENH